MRNILLLLIICWFTAANFIEGRQTRLPLWNPGDWTHCLHWCPACSTLSFFRHAVSSFYYYASKRVDPVFVLHPGVDWFDLKPDNVWYGRIKVLYSSPCQSNLMSLLSLSRSIAPMIRFATRSSWNLQARTLNLCCNW
jgi:hypothetical protein